AMRLAGRPLFNGSDKDELLPTNLEQCHLTLSTNLARADSRRLRGAVRIEGTVVGTPPIYGVIAYFESAHDGGYHSPTATTVPDAEGRFAIEITDLAPCENGLLRIEFCHANGAVSERLLGYNVGLDRRV